MAVNPLGMNQGTNSFIRFENDGGTINTQVIDVRQGTITLSNPTGTTITMTNGTINAGTINVSTISSLPNIPGGTIGLITRVGNVGTVEVGTISAMPQVSVGTIPNTPGGTLGLVTSVTTVANLSNGSVRVTVGTVNAGTVNTGTVNTGTINTGTINVSTATLQPYPASQVLSTGTTTASTIGTLVAAPGAGNGVYPTSLIINAISGTPEVNVSFGLTTNGAQVINRGLYPAGGGVAISYPYPSYYGTANSALTFNILSGSGTLSYAITYTTKGTP